MAPKPTEAKLDLSGIEFEAPKGSIVVQSKSGLYKPDLCKTVGPDGVERCFPVRGILMGAEYKKADSDLPFWVMEFRLTMPTFVPDRTKGLVKLDVGDTCLVVVTSKLKPWLVVAQRAQTAKKLVELHLVPESKLDIGGGKSIWEYEVSIVAKHDALAMGSIADLLGDDDDDVPQLTAGNPTNTTANTTGVHATS